MINNRINNLRKKMSNNKIDAYLVPHSDPHQSEYISNYYKVREYITGFTGSAGDAVITMNKSGLWTDGRYFIQAEKELSSSEVELYRLGIDCSIIEFIKKNLKEGSTIAVDGKNLSLLNFRNLSKELKNYNFITNIDLIGEMWNEDGRPDIPNSKVYIFDEKYSGENTIDRINRLRLEMKNINADYYFLGSLDDIMYLLNIRGNDVTCNQVSISYLLVSDNDCILYIDRNKLEPNVISFLTSNNVTIKDYNMITNDISKIEANKSLFLDPSKTNLDIYNSINKDVNLIENINITTVMKAHKNQIEISNSKDTYIIDGVALVKFFNWLENEVKVREVSELEASDKLLEFRKMSDIFIEDSFSTISAYGENASMPHYKPTKEKSSIIERKGLYLVDSGGHYHSGTTDITRTIAMGELTEDEKYHYTLVLKAHISLMTSKFLKGTNGAYLDAFTRYNMWKQNINFGHGTGHGVGHVLNVHEGPQRIALANNSYPMEEGMITSDEPGIYIQGSHGIRIESIMVCVKDSVNEFGEWLAFDNLTYVPIDTRPVEKNLLTVEEISWLNNYNKMCYEKLSGLVSRDDLKYLKDQCKEI